MDGEGTFGDWALADIMIKNNRFHKINTVRNMTDFEIMRVLDHPIMYWFVLAHPEINPSTNTWALMQFRFNPYAENNRITYKPRSATDLSAIVAV
jgi:hypothetical protein